MQSSGTVFYVRTPVSVVIYRMSSDKGIISKSGVIHRVIFEIGNRF